MLLNKMGLRPAWYRMPVFMLHIALTLGFFFNYFLGVWFFFFEPRIDFLWPKPIMVFLGCVCAFFHCY